MNKAKILMIEDDADLCASWADLFDLLGYELVCHQKGLDALADEKGILSSNLIISDFYLPDINGVELIKKIRERKPALKAILLTGSRDAGVLDAAKKVPNCVILHKPINIEDIEFRLQAMFAA
jgi:DNA-binding NtrC family response regulator